MPTLNQLRAEWNALVPQAQARGIRVRTLRSVHENIEIGQRRLAQLRAQLNGSAATAVSTGEFTYGVELECILPLTSSHAQLAERIRAAGIPCNAEMYNHAARPAWKIVHDGSVHGSNGRGAEVVSPVLSGEDGFRQIKLVCEALQAEGARINTTCGFHVHVGARGEQVSFFKNLFALYARYQPVLDSTQPVSRQGNTYCRPLTEREVASLNRAGSINEMRRVMPQSRYKKLNLSAYWRHGTVEFRQHSGTVEAAKAIEWTRLCLGLCAAARRPATETLGQVVTLGTLVQLTGANPTHFERRVARFQRRAA